MWGSNTIVANEVNHTKLRVRWIKMGTNLLIMQHMKAINKSRPMATSIRWKHIVHKGQPERIILDLTL